MRKGSRGRWAGTFPPLNNYLLAFLILEPESKYPLEEPEKRCKKALCECDSKAAKCFSEATFNTSYTDYDTSKC